MGLVLPPLLAVVLRSVLIRLVLLILLVLPFPLVLPGV